LPPQQNEGKSITIIRSRIFFYFFLFSFLKSLRTWYDQWKIVTSL